MQKKKFKKTVTLAEVLGCGKIPSISQRLYALDTSTFPGIKFEDTMGTVTEGPHGTLLVPDEDTKFYKQNHTLIDYDVGGYSGVLEIIHANMCDAEPNVCVSRFTMTTADKIIITMGMAITGTNVIYKGEFMVKRVKTWECIDNVPTVTSETIYREDDGGSGPIKLAKVTDTFLGTPYFPSNTPYNIEVDEMNLQVRLNGGTTEWTDLPAQGYTPSCCTL